MGNNLIDSILSGFKHARDLVHVSRDVLKQSSLAEQIQRQTSVPLYYYYKPQTKQSAYLHKGTSLGQFPFPESARKEGWHIRGKHYDFYKMLMQIPDVNKWTAATVEMSGGNTGAVLDNYTSIYQHMYEQNQLEVFDKVAVDRNALYGPGRENRLKTFKYQIINENDLAGTTIVNKYGKVSFKNIDLLSKQLLGRPFSTTKFGDLSQVERLLREAIGEMYGLQHQGLSLGTPLNLAAVKANLSSRFATDPNMLRVIQNDEFWQFFQKHGETLLSDKNITKTNLLTRHMGLGKGYLPNVGVFADDTVAYYRDFDLMLRKLSFHGVAQKGTTGLRHPYDFFNAIKDSRIKTSANASPFIVSAIDEATMIPTALLSNFRKNVDIILRSGGTLRKNLLQSYSTPLELGQLDLTSLIKQKVMPLRVRKDLNQYFEVLRGAWERKTGEIVTAKKHLDVAGMLATGKTPTDVPIDLLNKVTERYYHLSKVGAYDIDSDVVLRMTSRFTKKSSRAIRSLRSGKFGTGLLDIQRNVNEQFGKLGIDTKIGLDSVTVDGRNKIKVKVSGRAAVYLDAPGHKIINTKFVSPIGQMYDTTDEILKKLRGNIGIIVRSGQTGTPEDLEKTILRGYKQVSKMYSLQNEQHTGKFRNMLRFDSVSDASQFRFTQHPEVYRYRHKEFLKLNNVYQAFDAGDKHSLETMTKRKGTRIANMEYKLKETAYFLDTETIMDTNRVNSKNAGIVYELSLDSIAHKGGKKQTIYLKNQILKMSLNEFNLSQKRFTLSFLKSHENKKYIEAFNNYFNPSHDLTGGDLEQIANLEAELKAAFIKKASAQNKLASNEKAAEHILMKFLGRNDKSTASRVHLLAANYNFDKSKLGTQFPNLGFLSNDTYNFVDVLSAVETISTHPGTTKRLPSLIELMTGKAPSTLLKEIDHFPPGIKTALENAISLNPHASEVDNVLIKWALRYMFTDGPLKAGRADHFINKSKSILSGSTSITDVFENVNSITDRLNRLKVGIGNVFVKGGVSVDSYIGEKELKLYPSDVYTKSGPQRVKLRAAAKQYFASLGGYNITPENKEMFRGLFNNNEIEAFMYKLAAGDRISKEAVPKNTAVLNALLSTEFNPNILTPGNIKKGVIPVGIQPELLDPFFGFFENKRAGGVLKGVPVRYLGRGTPKHSLGIATGMEFIGSFNHPTKMTRFNMPGSDNILPVNKRITRSQAAIPGYFALVENEMGQGKASTEFLKGWGFEETVRGKNLHIKLGTTLNSRLQLLGHINQQLNSVKVGKGGFIHSAAVAKTLNKIRDQIISTTDKSNDFAQQTNLMFGSLRKVVGKRNTWTPEEYRGLVDDMFKTIQDLDEIRLTSQDFKYYTMEDGSPEMIKAYRDRFSKATRIEVANVQLEGDAGVSLDLKLYKGAKGIGSIKAYDGDYKGMVDIDNGFKKQFNSALTGNIDGYLSVELAKGRGLGTLQAGRTRLIINGILKNTMLSNEDKLMELDKIRRFLNKKGGLSPSRTSDYLVFNKQLFTANIGRMGKEVDIMKLVMSKKTLNSKQQEQFRLAMDRVNNLLDPVFVINPKLAQKESVGDLLALRGPLLKGFDDFDVKQAHAAVNKLMSQMRRSSINSFRAARKLTGLTRQPSSYKNMFASNVGESSKMLNSNAGFIGEVLLKTKQEISSSNYKRFSRSFLGMIREDYGIKTDKTGNVVSGRSIKIKQYNHLKGLIDAPFQTVYGTALDKEGVLKFHRNLVKEVFDPMNEAKGNLTKYKVMKQRFDSLMKKSSKKHKGYLKHVKSFYEKLYGSKDFPAGQALFAMPYVTRANATLGFTPERLILAALKPDEQALNAASYHGYYFGGSTEVDLFNVNKPKKSLGMRIGDIYSAGSYLMNMAGNDVKAQGHATRFSKYMLGHVNMDGIRMLEIANILNRYEDVPPNLLDKANSLGHLTERISGKLTKTTTPVEKGRLFESLGLFEVLGCLKKHTFQKRGGITEKSIKNKILFVDVTELGSSREKIMRSIKGARERGYVDYVEGNDRLIVKIKEGQLEQINQSGGLIEQLLTKSKKTGKPLANFVNKNQLIASKTNIAALEEAFSKTILGKTKLHILDIDLGMIQGVPRRLKLSITGSDSLMTFLQRNLGKDDVSAIAPDLVNRMWTIYKTLHDYAFDVGNVSKYEKMADARKTLVQFFEIAQSKQHVFGRARKGYMPSVWGDLDREANDEFWMNSSTKGRKGFTGYSRKNVGALLTKGGPDKLFQVSTGYAGLFDAAYNNPSHLLSLLRKTKLAGKYNIRNMEDLYHILYDAKNAGKDSFKEIIKNEIAEELKKTPTTGVLTGYPKHSHSQEALVNVNFTRNILDKKIKVDPFLALLQYRDFDGDNVAMMLPMGQIPQDDLSYLMTKQMHGSNVFTRSVRETSMTTAKLAKIYKDLGVISNTSGTHNLKLGNSLSGLMRRLKTSAAYDNRSNAYSLTMLKKIILSKDVLTEVRNNSGWTGSILDVYEHKKGVLSLTDDFVDALNNPKVEKRIAGLIKGNIETYFRAQTATYADQGLIPLLASDFDDDLLQSVFGVTGKIKYTGTIKADPETYLKLLYEQNKRGGGKGMSSGELKAIVNSLKDLQSSKPFLTAVKSAASTNRGEAFLGILATNFGKTTIPQLDFASEMNRLTFGVARGMTKVHGVKYMDKILTKGFVKQVWELTGRFNEELGVAKQRTEIIEDLFDIRSYKRFKGILSRNKTDTELKSFLRVDDLTNLQKIISKDYIEGDADGELLKGLLGKTAVTLSRNQQKLMATGKVMQINQEYWDLYNNIVGKILQPQKMGKAGENIMHLDGDALGIKSITQKDAVAYLTSLSEHKFIKPRGTFFANSDEVYTIFHKLWALNVTSDVDEFNRAFQKPLGLDKAGKQVTLNQSELKQMRNFFRVTTMVSRKLRTPGTPTDAPIDMAGAIGLGLLDFEKMTDKAQKKFMEKAQKGGLSKSELTLLEKTMKNKDFMNTILSISTMEMERAASKAGISKMMTKVTESAAKSKSLLPMIGLTLVGGIALGALLGGPDRAGQQRTRYRSDLTATQWKMFKRNKVITMGDNTVFGKDKQYDNHKRLSGMDINYGGKQYI